MDQSAPGKELPDRVDSFHLLYEGKWASVCIVVFYKGILFCLFPADQIKLSSLADTENGSLSGTLFLFCFATLSCCWWGASCSRSKSPRASVFPGHRTSFSQGSHSRSILASLPERGCRGALLSAGEDQGSVKGLCLKKSNNFGWHIFTKFFMMINYKCFLHSSEMTESVGCYMESLDLYSSFIL